MALAQAIARRAARHEVWIALNACFPESVSRIRHAFDTLIPPERIVLFQVPAPVAEIDPTNAWRIHAAELVREHWLSSLLPDVVHVSSLFEGLGDDAVTSVGPINGDAAISITLYDLIPMMRASAYLADSRIRNWYYRKLQSLKNAALMLAISEYSREEAITALSLPEQNIVNISSAADPQFRVRIISKQYERIVRARYGLERPFVMHVGGVDDARKNIEKLIEAYAQLPNSLRGTHQLAVVCSMSDSERQRLMKLATNFGLRRDELVLTGYVAEEDLVLLYNLCRLFVFPSLYEGFGLPVLEAMACGAPVIGSNATSIPEVIGRADALFDPTQPETIAKAMAHALSDNDFRRELRANSTKQAAKFSWDESGRRALEALEALHDRKSAEKRKEVVSIRHRPRMAYVSPLPPVPSGIADYSAELVPELARYYDIELIVDQPQVEHAWLTANFATRNVEWFTANAHNFDRILYHFGNNYFHRHMFDLLQRHPGIAVVHDFYLSGVYDWMDATGHMPKAFPHALYASYGYAALDDMEKRGREAATWSYPCNKDVLDRAVGIIVHSQYSVKAAEQWYGPACADDWRVIPHLRALPPRLDMEQARKTLGLRSENFIVCSFGFLNVHKLNDRLLEAWLRSPLASDKDCYLVFVGENHQGEYGQKILQRIKNSRVHDRIRITGYADVELYRAYLAAADIAVQLRARTRGETSGTVLDCLAHGIPLIINAHGPMAEYPDEILVKLRDDFSDDELAAALEDVWRCPEGRTRLSERGRNYVRTQHHPAHVGEQYRKAIEYFSQVGPKARYQRLLGSLRNISTSVEPSEPDLEVTASSIAANMPQTRLRHLLVDVSELVLRDVKSGIQRVVRSVLLQLLRSPPKGFRVEPVYSDGNGYYYARRFTLGMLGVSADGFRDAPVDVQRGDIYIGLDLVPQLVPESQGWFDEIRLKGVEVYFVIYDLLPQLSPQFFAAEAKPLFERWMQSVTAVADGLIGISRAVADEIEMWLKAQQLERAEPLKIGYFHLGADIEQSAPTSGLPDDAVPVLQALSSLPTFIMVGTIEPRKGCAQALAAFEQLWADGLEANLVFVGKQGWMVEQVVERLHNHPELGKRLFWLEGISDEYLKKVYGAGTALIAASEGEGFGLPLIEAAQHGLQIIARDLPVFREVARQHAFYFSGTSPEDLVMAIQRWLDLYAKGKTPRSDTMPWLTWKESTQQLLDVILGTNWYKLWTSDNGCTAELEKCVVKLT